MENDMLLVNSDKDLLVILDTHLYPDLENEGIARELVNRIQRLRKRANLNPTDDIRMLYSVVDIDEVGIDEIIEKQEDLLIRTLRGKLERLSTGDLIPDSIIVEEQALTHGSAVCRLKLALAPGPGATTLS
jgi:isoleucyl-tRNA synthetase